MYWSIRSEPVGDVVDSEMSEPNGRFVLHRHRDSDGPHLDLRLEEDGYLIGWRIDGELDEECWASEKGPHPVRWLEHDGSAVREDAGLYTWLGGDKHERALLLEGERESRALRARREEGLRPRAVREIRDALVSVKSSPKLCAGLIRDGASARERSTERLCGLGRELDGSRFDEGLWRKTLGDLSLDEIHVHLRAYEERFDRKYPPLPVSQPETLKETGGEAETERVLKILREGENDS